LVVARPVVDHEHCGAEAADRRRDPREHLADVVLLVVGRHHDGDSVAEALGQPGGVELVRRDALQGGRQLALDPPVLHQRAHREQEQRDDREHGQAEDPAAVAALERERAQQRVQ
jgi:hypothetical protein